MTLTAAERQKRYRENSRDKWLANGASFRERHRLALRESGRERERRRRLKARSEALAAFGGTCNRCGFNDERALQIDHCQGDGKQERTKVFGGDSVQFYRYVLKNLASGRFQLLCANCNWIKRSERGEHC